MISHVAMILVIFKRIADQEAEHSGSESIKMGLLRSVSGQLQSRPLAYYRVGLWPWADYRVGQKPTTVGLTLIS